jgi:hypothetical protein
VVFVSKNKSRGTYDITGISGTGKRVLIQMKRDSLKAQPYSLSDLTDGHTAIRNVRL